MLEIDRLPVKDLPARYGIGKTALYSRISVAGVKPEKKGNKSYVSGKDLEELDRLDAHLAAGGTLEDFQARFQSGELSTKSPVDNPPESLLDGSMIELNQPNIALLKELMELMALLVKPSNKLAYMDTLEKAVEKDWILTTQEIKDLIGCKPTLKNNKNSYTRGCWRFVKSGKIGNQNAWRIKKIKKEEN